MSLSVSLVVFSAGNVIRSADVNSNFSALNSASINADQLGGIGPTGFAQASNSTSSPIRVGVGHALPGSGMVKWDVFFLTPFS